MVFHIDMESPPFQKECQLNDGLDMIDPVYLPGHPRITTSHAAKLHTFLDREFNLRDLEELAPRLWMMSKQDSRNISPLHRQRVKGRDIIVTEDPRMHLVWYYDRIFVKPLPKYLLSHAFWTNYLSTTSPLGAKQGAIRRCALGYLRTYFYLIVHESDFRIATDDKLCLVPRGISWEQFCNFSCSLDSIQDDAVSERYMYGEIRLSRLNLYSKIFLRRRHFQRMNAQYGVYFARFYGPILFTFGVFSILLSTMQVEVAVEQLSATDHGILLWPTCRWLSICCFLLTISISIWLALLFAFKFMMEWVYAIKDRRSKKGR